LPGDTDVPETLCKRRPLLSYLNVSFHIVNEVANRSMPGPI